MDVADSSAVTMLRSLWNVSLSAVASRCCTAGSFRRAWMMAKASVGVVCRSLTALA